MSQNQHSRRIPSLLATALALALAGVLHAAAAEPELISRDALFGNPERANVKISPDGSTLSWIAPVNGVLNVWVAPADDLSKARAVTDDKARGIRDYFWSYRPGTLLYLRDTGGDENFHLYSLDLASGDKRDLSPFPKTRADLHPVSPLHPDAIVVGMNDRDAEWHDLYRVDLASGARTLVEKNTGKVADYLVDADYTVRMTQKTRADGGVDLFAPDGKGGWQKTGDIPFSDFMSTSPGNYTHDGSTLYFRDSRGRDTVGLYAVDANGNKTLLAEDPRADVGDILYDPKTGEADAVSVNYLRQEWRVLDPSITPDLAKLKAIGPGDVFVSARTADDRTWIVTYAAAEAAPVYYRYDRDGGALAKLFSSRPVLDGKPLVPMWAREVTSRDGLTLVSYLSLPPGTDPDNDGRPDKAVPMVLFVHGGPWARDSYGYRSAHQWLANRGYAVLSVNYRGSTGFGKNFVTKADGEWGGKMHDDLIDAVAWAVRSGITSKDQVAIMGGSYGGYATLAGMTFTPDTFKCGVDIVGVANLHTFMKTVPPYWASFMEQWYKRVGDPRTEAGRKLLTDRSPLTHAGAIKKPLLIGHGVNDARVNKAESDQVVETMQAKNIPVTYVLFPDEGHGFQRPENAKAFYAVAEGFLGECLGGRVEPIGDDFAGSSINVPVGADDVAGLADALKTHKAEARN